MKNMNIRDLRHILISFLLTLNCTVLAFGQFSHAKIGVNGMTCSACTKSVETSLRKLPFVESVVMNLENNSGEITFKKGQSARIENIAKAIVDAGFSVRFLTAEYTFKEDNFSTSEYSENNYNFQFLRSKPKQKNCTLRFIGQKYQAKKEFTKYKTEFPEIDFKKENKYYVIPQ